MTYEDAFERVIGHEGNFQNDPKDRGNWTTGIIGKGKLNGTKYGISAMSYPDLDIKNLTLKEAKAIYYKGFWKRVNGDQLPSAIAYQLFDSAINHGIGTAIRFLQRAVGVADDGWIGPVTLAAIDQVGVDDTLKLFNAERIEFFTKLSTFDSYGRGWMRRVAQNLRYAANDYE